MVVTPSSALAIILGMIIGNIVIELLMERVAKGDKNWVVSATGRIFCQLSGILIFLLVLYFTQYIKAA